MKNIQSYPFNLSITSYHAIYISDTSQSNPRNNSDIFRLHLRHIAYTSQAHPRHISHTSKQHFIHYSDTLLPYLRPSSTTSLIYLSNISPSFLLANIYGVSQLHLRHIESNQSPGPFQIDLRQISHVIPHISETLQPRLLSHISFPSKTHPSDF